MARTPARRPATVLNSIMEVTARRVSWASRACTSPGSWAPSDDAAKEGSLSIRIGLGWAKSHSFTTGQCPVMRYNRQLMNAILRDKVQIAEGGQRHDDHARRSTAGLRRVRRGVAKKFVLDPHGMVKASRRPLTEHTRPAPAVPRVWS